MGIFSRSTPRNFKVRKKTSTPLLPEAAEVFIARRITDIAGLMLIGIGLSLGLALISYDVRDPSINNAATGVEPHNMLGALGAYVSDALLQTLGLASYLFAIAFIVWGLRIFMRRPVGHYSQRLMLLLGSALACSVMLARVPSFESWGMGAYLGGSAGALIFTNATGYLQAWIGKPAFVFMAVVSFGVFASCYLLTLGVSLGEWTSGFGSLREMATGLREMIAHAWSRIGEWHGSRATAKFPAPMRVSRIHLHEDAAKEIQEEESPLPASLRQKPIVIPRASKLKSSAAKAKEEKQKKLDLWSSDEEWQLPPLDLLHMSAPAANYKLDEASLQKNAEMLQSTLRDFGIEGDILKVSPGPIVTLYEMEPAPGTKTSRVIGLSDDIARSMSAISVRIAVVPGKNVIGIELPNVKRETVYLQEMLSSSDYEKAPVRLPLALGKNIAGDAVIADLARMPHLLVAGTTGSGKSVAINTMILSLLYRLSPEQCRLIMIDPKMLELSVYDEIPHLLTPVVTEPRRAITALKWAVREMEDRYRAMSKLGVRNIDGFNERIRDARGRGEVLTHKVQTGFDPDTGRPLYEEQPLPQTELPYIVIIVDEFADLMLVAGKEVENSIQRLAQMARAAGIHLIMATQRPSVDVITGVIKANFPTRISFQVTSKIDSRTILGEGGAEQLLGQGDMLYMAAGGRLTRVHGPFVTDEEVEKIVKHLRAQGAPVYIDAVTEDTEEGESGEEQSGGVIDELYDRAVHLVLSERKASTSFIQRHFQIGYNRAARIIERMEKEGIISAASHVGKREVLAGEHYGT